MAKRHGKFRASLIHKLSLATSQLVKDGHMKLEAGETVEWILEGCVAEWRNLSTTELMEQVEVMCDE